MQNVTRSRKQNVDQKYVSDFLHAAFLTVILQSKRVQEIFGEKNQVSLLYLSWSILSFPILYVSTYKQMHRHIQAYTHTYMYACIGIHIHKYRHTQNYMHTYTDTHINIYMYRGKNRKLRRVQLQRIIVLVYGRQ